MVGGHEPHTLPYRSYRPPMGTAGAVRAARQARRPAPYRRPPRRPHCLLLPPAGRLRLAAAAPRLPAVEHRVLLRPPLAPGRRLGTAARAPPRGGPPGRGAAESAQRRRPRQPDGEGGRLPRGPEGLRRGEKKLRRQTRLVEFGLQLSEVAFGVTAEPPALDPPLPAFGQRGPQFRPAGPVGPPQILEPFGPLPRRRRRQDPRRTA